jgi:hypothetical protein
MIVHGIESHGRISGPYLRALRGRKRGLCPGPIRVGTLDLLTVRVSVICSLAAAAAVVWALAFRA